MRQPAWLNGALDYIGHWLAHQMRQSEQPGCAISITFGGKLVLEQAFGYANLARKTRLTPRHRFRVASHSKTFSATGVLLLREQGHLQLDQAIGDFVADLHPDLASVTIGQLLSHSAGTVRDGADAGQWQDRRPFLDAAAVRADLAEGPVITPNSRFKYSNHGYALIGMAIEAITGEPYRDWIMREVVRASGLAETLADSPVDDGRPLASGHSGKVLLGRRVAIPAENPTHALASATGFISTAADLALFFASLSPGARTSVLSAGSRREMSRRQWRDPHSSIRRWYGLGTISGDLADWAWFGHTGGFQGHVTRTVVVPEQDIAISVLTNASDGMSHLWLDGALHILRTCRREGAPTRGTTGWRGRWWSLWGPFDLLPVAGKVLVANPTLANPMLDATEIAPAGRSRDGTLRGTISLAGGYASHGEPARLVCNGKHEPTELWLGGNRLVPQGRAARELARRYGGEA